MTDVWSALVKENRRAQAKAALRKAPTPTKAAPRKAPNPVGRRPQQHAGDKFGEWTLLEYRSGRMKPTRVYGAWYCRCSCGVERWVKTDNLTWGVSKSCGHSRGHYDRKSKERQREMQVTAR